MYMYVRPCLRGVCVRACVCVYVCVCVSAFLRMHLHVWTTITIHMYFEIVRLDFNMFPMAPAQTRFWLFSIYLAERRKLTS